MVRRVLRRGTFGGCDADLVVAFDELAAALTTSHSLTSRNPSVWTLLAERVDAAVQALPRPAIARSIFDISLVVPSRFGSTWPPADTATDKSIERENDSIRSAYEMCRQRIDAWDRYVRHGIQAIRTTQPGEKSEDDLGLAESLDSLRQLLFALRLMRPETVRPRQSAIGRLRPVEAQHHTETFCQLCWRQTMRATSGRWLGPVDSNSSPPPYSSRYCEYHLPLDNPPSFNLYRTDIRYKDTFNREILAGAARASSRYEVRLQPPVGGDMAEIRKAAYDTVHCGIKSLRVDHGLERSSAEIVWRRYREGMTQSDIAAELGVSKPSVSRTLRNLRETVRRHEREAQIDPLTDEPFSLQFERTWQHFERLRELWKEGISTAEAARKLGVFKPTIKAMARWIAIIDQIHTLANPRVSSASLAVRLHIAPGAIDLIRRRLERTQQANTTIELDEARLKRVLEPLRRWFDHGDIDEVCVTEPYRLTVERGGKHQAKHMPMLTADRITEMARVLDRYLSNVAGFDHPPGLAYGWLPTGERVMLSSPPAVASDRTTIALRKPRIPEPE